MKKREVERMNENRRERKVRGRDEKWNEWEVREEEEGNIREMKSREWARREGEGEFKIPFNFCPFVQTGLNLRPASRRSPLFPLLTYEGNNIWWFYNVYITDKEKSVPGTNWFIAVNENIYFTHSSKLWYSLGLATHQNIFLHIVSNTFSLYSNTF